MQDLYALLKFLRVHPFDSLPYFNIHVAQPLRTIEKGGVQRLKKVFQCVALRRTKNTVMDQLHLPARRSRTYVVEFSPQEDKMYRVLRRSLSYFIRPSHMNNDHNKHEPTGSVLSTITRLRRFCNNNLDLLPSKFRILLEELADEEDIVQAVTDRLKTCYACREKPLGDDPDDLAPRFAYRGHDTCAKSSLGRSSLHRSYFSYFAFELSLNLSDDADYEQAEIGDNSYQPSSKVLAMLRNISAEQDTEPGIKCSAAFFSLKYVASTIMTSPVSYFLHGLGC